MRWTKARDHWLGIGFATLALMVSFAGVAWSAAKEIFAVLFVGSAFVLWKVTGKIKPQREPHSLPEDGKAI